MIYPTKVQNINFKYFVFWATQKWQMCGSEYVYFKSPNLSDFFIFVYPAVLGIMQCNVAGF
jgi:hypothetical protein